MGRIELLQGDITQMEVDAIVNAANSRLRGGGGVDGAIHRGGGPAIMAECDQIRERQGGCPTGEAVITTAGNLPAQHVIHTVGPVWGGGNKNEENLLARAYRNSLDLAGQSGLRSICFPNISTGIYGFPKKEAARIAVREVGDFLDQNDLPEEVIFVCFDKENYSIYDLLLNN